MTRLKKFLVLVALAMFSVPAFINQTVKAQVVTGPTRTTLSSALGAPNAGSGSTQIMVVGSATGITARTASLQQFCLIDQEMVEVVSVSSTNITIRRARLGVATAHVSGATVICGYTGRFDPNTGAVSTVVGSPTVGASVNGAVFVSTLPVGTCSRSSNPILPVIYPHPRADGAPAGYFGSAIDCLGGLWVPGTLPDYPPQSTLVLATNVPIGGVAYASIGTNTADVNGQEWLTSIYVPQTAWVTGVSFMSGGTATTDNMYVILRDSAGNVMATSALAGAVLSGANTFQTRAFTSQILLVGPARYFVSVVGNGTAAGAIETISASTYTNVVCATASGTFGTVTATFTVPTTFTAGKCPVVQIYY